MRACMRENSSARCRSVTKNPLCTAQLRNGQPCRMVIESDGAEFCPYHLGLVEEHGSETLKKGALPKEQALRVVEEPSKPERAAADGTVAATSADPATIRQKLASAAAENVEQLKEMLLDAVGSATKPVWVTAE